MTHKLQMSAGAERGHARFGVRQHTLAAVYDAQDRGHPASVGKGQVSRLLTNVVYAYLPLNWPGLRLRRFSRGFSRARPAYCAAGRKQFLSFNASHQVPAKIADARHFVRSIFFNHDVPPERQYGEEDVGKLQYPVGEYQNAVQC